MTVSQDVVEIKFGRASLRTRISQNDIHLILLTKYLTREVNHDPLTIITELLLDVALSASPPQLLQSRCLSCPLAVPSRQSGSRRASPVTWKARVRRMRCVVTSAGEAQGHRRPSFRIDSRSPMKREKSNKRGIAL